MAVKSGLGNTEPLAERAEGKGIKTFLINEGERLAEDAFTRQMPAF